MGCGTAWIADHFPEYTGIDASPEAIEQATRLGRNALLADAGSPLDFGDSSFEGVILKDVLEHLHDPVSPVREAHRVLKPGGRVFASAPDAQRWVWNDYTHRRPFTRTSFRHLFEDQGFIVERVGYELVVPGTGVVSGWTRRRRRPRMMSVLAWLPFLRRNVWVLARKPG